MVNKELIQQLSKEDIKYITEAYIQGLKELTLEMKDNPSLALKLDTALLAGDKNITFDLVYERIKL